MNLAKPGSIRDITRARIRKAFYSLDIYNTDKQYDYAESLGFDIAPKTTGKLVLRSFLNLSEDDGLRLLSQLLAL